MGNEIPLDIILENDPQQLIFSGADADEITLTITNNDTRNAESVLVNIVRADLLNKGDLSLTAEQLAGAGYQMIDDTWLEVRESAPDAWEPIDDWATPYDVGALAAGASASFEVRINRPALSDDAGRICFAIMISSKPADVPQVSSIVIDQTAPSVAQGATSTLTVTVTADVGADESVTWTSSDDSVFTVDSSGIITGVAEGSAIVRAVSVANPIKKSSRFVQVSAGLVSGMVAWFDASDTDTITHSGGDVTAWADKSGNGYDATQVVPGSEPRTGDHTINGLNVLTFKTGFLDAPTALIPAGTTQYTIFAVWAQDTGGTEMFLDMGDLTTNEAIKLYGTGTGANVRLVQDWHSNPLYSSYGYVAYGVTNIAACWWDGADRFTHINENEVSDSTAAKNTGTGACLIGKNRSGLPLDGKIGELVIYHSALTTEQIAANLAVLNEKWKP